MVANRSLKIVSSKNGLRPRLVDCRSGIRVDVWHHAAIENRLAILRAIVNTIQAHDRAAKIKADRTRDPLDLRQRVPKERRFILIARRGNERRNHVAISITKRDHLVAFELLVPVEADIVTTSLRRSA